MRNLKVLRWVSSANPIYQERIKSARSNIESSEACDVCSKGLQFYNEYVDQVSTQSEFDDLFATAQIICQLEEKDLLTAFFAENQQSFDQQMASWFIWGSDKQRIKEASESFWNRPDAWQLFYRDLRAFANTYLTFQQQLQEGSLPNSFLKAMVNARTVEFLQLYTVAERLDLIQNLLPEIPIHDDDVLQIIWEEWCSNSEENAILNLLKSFSTQDEAILVLQRLSTNALIKNLNYHLDDFGFGDDSYTSLSNEFHRLVKLKFQLEDQDAYEEFWDDLASNRHFTYNDSRTFGWGVPPEEGGVKYNRVTYDDHGEMEIEYVICEEVEIKTDRTFIQGGTCV